MRLCEVQKGGLGMGVAFDDSEVEDYVVTCRVAIVFRDLWTS